jgi:predicted Zn-dependent protease
MLDEAIFRARRTIDRRLGKLSYRWWRFSQRLHLLRVSLRSALRRITPQWLVGEISYHLGTLLFGHRRKYLLLGAVAFGLFLLMMVASAIGVLQLRHSLIDRYTRQALTARDSGQYAEAVNYGRWLAWLEPTNQSHQLLLAEGYDRLGQREEAAGLWARLAPDDHIEYPPAHVVRVRFDLAADNVLPGRLERIEHELDLLADEGLDADELDELRLRLYLRTGRFADAQRILDEHPKLPPAARLEAARTFASLDLKKAAHRQAGIAIKQFARLIAAAEQIDTRVQWAEATALVGDVAQAEQILRTGLVLHPKGPFAVELARLYLQLAMNARQDEPQRNALLVAGIRLLGGEQTLTGDGWYALYQLHLARGNANLAFDCLSKVVASDRSKLLELARFQALRGGPENARQLALKFKDDCFAALDKRPFDRSLRLLTAEALVLLRDYPTAAKVLDEPYRQIHEPAYSAALGRVYLAWWDVEAGKQQRTHDADIELLEKASNYFPCSVELARRCSAARKSLSGSDAQALARLDQIERRWHEARIE